jgi:ornithine cyclodeaminase/alanine dehydrogenase-like protein (mu-crystallin family)
VAPGTFIGAVGADSQGKQEIDAKLVATATLVYEKARASGCGTEVMIDD